MTNDDKRSTRNLLTAPLIRIEDAHGSVSAQTLPGVLAALATGAQGLNGFSGLQPHQWPAWHAFLVQLATLATIDHPGDPPDSEEGWRDALRGLTPDHPGDEPWCLTVPDVAQPAFMQPPVPEGSLARFEGPYESPDASALDVLVTATDHDVKTERQTQAGDDQWIFGVIAYQTFSGYGGKNNHGVIRMNGGYATRPLIGIAWSAEWTDLFRRDLEVLRAHHDRTAEAKELTPPGRRLLWLQSWDGASSIPWVDCDPYAIEVARRVRLLNGANGLSAWRRSTPVPRVSPKSDVLKGNVGDPWIPVTAEGQAVNLSASGWDYQRVRQILLEDGYAWAACQQQQANDPQDLWFYAVGLARGQGKTQGFHERWIRIPGHIPPKLFAPATRKTLGELSRERVERAGQARKVLHRALAVLLAGGPAQPDFRDDSDRRWLDRYEARVDAAFFESLWADAEEPQEVQRANWDRALREIIEESVWPEAEAEAPTADARRERAQARAWMALRGGLKRTIPNAFGDEEEVYAVS